MDTILTVNAGSSSVKFEVFAVRCLNRRARSADQGTDGRHRDEAAAPCRGPDGAPLVDQMFSSEEVADVPAALHSVAEWLRHQHAIEPIAVGHRVVHGGPQYDPPVLIDDRVLADLERCVPLAPLHQPNNLAPIRLLLERFPRMPADRLLRYRLSSQPRRARRSFRHSGMLLRGGCASLRLSRSFV